MNALSYVRCVFLTCIAVVSLASPAAASRMLGGVDADPNYLAMALDPMFSGTVGIRVEYADGTFHIGTGNVTDISASGGTNILTNAHVLSPAVAVSVTTSKNMYDPNAVYHTADDWQYFDASVGLGADIGFIHLNVELPEVTPIDIYMGNALPRGTELYLAGYGEPSYYPDATQLPFDGYLRAGTNSIAQVGGGLIPDEYIRMDFGPAGRGAYGPLEYGLTNGGSGGPVIFSDPLTGDYWLYALNKSFGTISYDTYALRPSYWVPEYDAFRVSNSVPEPASGLLLGTIAFGLYRTRRRQSQERS